MECSICLSKNNKEPEQIFCSNNHTFHINCIKSYMKFGSNFNCPLCRQDLLPIKKYKLRITDQRFKSLDNKRYPIKSEQHVFDIIRGFALDYEIEDDHICKTFILYELGMFIKKHGWVIEISEPIVFEKIKRYINTRCLIHLRLEGNLENMYINKIITFLET